MSRPVALVTGASRGIGQAIYSSLLDQGYNLALVGRDEEAFKAFKQKRGFWKGPPSADQFFITDLSKTEQLPSLIKQVTDHFGRLDVLINNAGLCIESEIEVADLDKWDQALDVNLRACIHLTRHALPYLKKSESGAIINIGSTAGTKAYRNGANYCATKFGLRGFSLALFEDVRKHGIKVCLIEPGYVNTNMHDPIKEGLESGKMLQPEDIAETVNYVLKTPSHVCPLEITLVPQIDPRLARR